MSESTEIRIEQEFKVKYTYPVVFTRQVFSAQNTTIAKLIENRANSPVILPVIDSQVLRAHPELPQQIIQYFKKMGLSSLPSVAIEGGEVCKNTDQTIDKIYQLVLDHKIDRHSYIIAIGGGAVIDAVGYAAATAHRGIRLIRLPTTVLAQNDAAVGVKNAINYQGRKNFLGTFALPLAVICDFDLLGSLEERDKRAGIAEAIKVALIKDRTFFTELYKQRDKLAAFDAPAMENMIIKGAKWHLDHIANHGDPFESGSSRPLDFGHWSAHKLEEISQHDLRHGEAVAIGIAMDSIYSHKAGLLAKPELDKILELLKVLGFTLYHPALDSLDVSKALHDFKEHLGGRLCIMLLETIGSGVEVDNIDAKLMKLSIATLKEL